jgi:hypothetical protein
MKIKLFLISLLYSINVSSLVFTEEQILDYAFVAVYNTTCEKFSSNGKRLFLRDINSAYGSLELALQDEKFGNALTSSVGIKLISGEREFCKAMAESLKETSNYNRMFR